MELSRRSRECDVALGIFYDIKRTGLVQETKLNAFRPLGWKSEATPNLLIMLSAQTFKHNLTTYM